MIARPSIFPCDRCYLMAEDCPCHLGDIEWRRAAARVSRRHKESVARARSGRALDRRKRAAA